MLVFLKGNFKMMLTIFRLNVDYLFKKLDLRLNVDYLFKKLDLHLTVESFREKKIDLVSFNAKTEVALSSKRGPYLWKPRCDRKRGARLGQV